MTMNTGTNGPPTRTRRREVGLMEKPDDVAVMLRLHAAGWGAKAIAKELGCARNTVRRYLRQGGWVGYGGDGREKVLDEHQAWIDERFDRHAGNAEVVRQELVAERSVDVSLRTVERAVVERRRRRRTEATATVRFETPPGKQLQVDFGERLVTIGGVKTKVHFCVITLGWSRRTYVRAFRNERQANWFETLEGSFREFGGVPAEVLVDNARALVSVHNVETGEVVFSDRFSHFARYWGFKPRACAPYRARTKGKDERGVQYAKRNAIAGRTFESWEALEAWLIRWPRENADVREHGTTGEQPIVRFERDERSKLRPIDGRPPFLLERELERVVHSDACVEVDTNWYSVPWPLGGSQVLVKVADDVVTVTHAGEEVARHARALGRRVRVVEQEHWEGLWRRPAPPQADPTPESLLEFGRSLDDYAAIVDEEAA